MLEAKRQLYPVLRVLALDPGPAQKRHGKGMEKLARRQCDAQGCQHLYRPRRKLDSLIAFRRASLALFVTSARFPRPSVASVKTSTGASRLYDAGVISWEWWWAGILGGRLTVRAASFFSKRFRCFLFKPVKSELITYETPAMNPHTANVDTALLSL